jgi:hypothetical protein
VPPFAITDAVRSWYREALIRDEIPDGFISVRERLDFEFDKSPRVSDVATRAKLECETTVQALDGTWTGKSIKSELWEKTGDLPWLVSDY